MSTGQTVASNTSFKIFSDLFKTIMRGFLEKIRKINTLLPILTDEFIKESKGEFFNGKNAGV